jgi:hypothetical protein
MDAKGIDSKRRLFGSNLLGNYPPIYTRILSCSIAQEPCYSLARPHAE